MCNLDTKLMDAAAEVEDQALNLIWMSLTDVASADKFTLEQWEGRIAKTTQKLDALKRVVTMRADQAIDREHDALFTIPIH